MDGSSAVSTFGLLVQILTLDLLLSGDNALVIALACRHLPPEKARLAAWLGAAGAIFLRFTLTAATGALMSLPFLQMASAFPLIVIALHLMAGDEEGGLLGGGGGDIFAVAGLIIVSDAAMSIDNVVALAAVAGGNVWLLLIGFLVSVPLIVFGSFGFGRLIRLYPWLVDAGGALLGWIAGGLVVNDPVIAPWVRIQAPALQVTLPLAVAIFVLIQGRASRSADAAAEKDPAETPTILAPAILAPAILAPAILAPKVSAPTILAPEHGAAKEIEAPETAVEPPVLAAPAAAAPSLAPPAPPAEPPEPAVEPPEETSGQDHGDRVMLIGLAALFLVFGLFLALFIAIPE